MEVSPLPFCLDLENVWVHLQCENICSQSKPSNKDDSPVVSGCASIKDINVNGFMLMLRQWIKNKVVVLLHLHLVI